MLSPGRFVCGVELVSTRGSIAEQRARETREMAGELLQCDFIDWMSITDNAGGNPQLSPLALGKPILYGGKEVIIHLSCKDFNRNGLESQAWQLESEGFHNILALSGDYPIAGYRGASKSVFDIDSVALLTMLSEMNRGMDVRSRGAGTGRTLQQTRFLLGAVGTNFKKYESEVIPQYLKLRKKLEAGAQFIICQIGYDARKSHEMKLYLDHNGYRDVPLIGNVFLLNARVAEVFRSGRIPGVVVSDQLYEQCRRWGDAPGKGRAFFIELAAKQVAIFRGLGYRGVYMGGVDEAGDLTDIWNLANTFAADDWKQFARELSYSRPGEFFLYERDSTSGLSDPHQLNREYLKSLEHRKPSHNVTLGYRLSKWMHDRVFTPGSAMFNLGRRIYGRAKDTRQGPLPLRVLEHASKAAMFSCKDCGDCSLPEIAFSCPESACAKNQRNGPCGGTRDGKCEVFDFECIWSIAYDRLKYEGREQQMLDYEPVIQDQSLRGTSSWANTFLCRDHHSRVQAQTQPETSPCPTPPPQHPLQIVQEQELEPIGPSRSSES
jgi:methylenetetrahydrofolate reductase (NADPH)